MKPYPVIWGWFHKPWHFGDPVINHGCHGMSLFDSANGKTFKPLEITHLVGNISYISCWDFCFMMRNGSCFLVWITLLAWPPCFFGVLHPPHLRFLYSIGPQPKALGSCGRRCASTSRVEAQEAGSSLGQNWSFTAEWNFRNVQRYYLIIHSMFMLEKHRIRMHADMYTDNVTYTDTNTLYITISQISIYHMVYTYYICYQSKPKAPPFQSSASPWSPNHETLGRLWTALDIQVHLLRLMVQKSQTTTLTWYMKPFNK